MADFNADKPFDFERGFTIDFDMQTGLSSMLDTGKRYLSQMKKECLRIKKRLRKNSKMKIQ